MSILVLILFHTCLLCSAAETLDRQNVPLDYVTEKCLATAAEEAKHGV